MSINLGGADVGMAKEGLNGAEIGAVHKEVCGKRMAESVGSDVFGDAGLFGIFFDDTLDGTLGEATEISRSVN